jgi:putative colanic acid biosynthesis acetyltransferase WcaF
MDKATCSSAAERMRFEGAIWSLADFRGHGYDKGRPVLIQAAWFAAMNLVFMKWWFPPRWRPALLRLFGAEVGTGVLIRHRVRIQWPWKLHISNNTWIGEGSWIMNLENVEIGSNVCISQEASLVTGGHNRRSQTFEFDNAPIVIDDGAWIAFRACLLRGTKVGRGAIVGAGCVVSRDVQANEIIR